jgi:hypothetical protein
VRKFGVKNGPVDRRRLSDQDKAAYNTSGGYAERAQAVSRVRAYRGNMAYQSKRPVASTPHTPGTGGMGVGLVAQNERNREIGSNKRISESYRPEIDSKFTKYLEK